MNASTLVQKLWNYCNVLRDDGMSYGDYVEQLTYLLFLKMADERSQPPYNQPSIDPRRLGLAVAAGEGRRRAVRPLPPHAGGAGQAEGHARPDLRQGAEQVPGPGQAAPPDRGPDRRRELVGAGRRREGRRLRGPAGEERAGHQERRGPVLHAARADPGHGRLHRAQAGRDDLRPGLRHRRLPARRPRLRRRAQRQPRRATRSSTCKEDAFTRLRSWCRPRRGCAR